MTVINVTTELDALMSRIRSMPKDASFDSCYARAEIARDCLRMMPDLYREIIGLRADVKRAEEEYESVCRTLKALRQRNFGDKETL